MTRRQRRKLYGLPGIAPFQVVEDGSECDGCGFYPLDRGDWAWFDDRWELLTCSALCAGKARAREIRELEEWEAEQRREDKRPTPLAGDGDLFDGNRCEHGHLPDCCLSCASVEARTRVSGWAVAR